MGWDDLPSEIVGRILEKRMVMMINARMRPLSKPRLDVRDDAFERILARSKETREPCAHLEFWAEDADSYFRALLEGEIPS